MCCMMITHSKQVLQIGAFSRATTLTLTIKKPLISTILEPFQIVLLHTLVIIKTYVNLAC